jgi:type IV pilus assembly protein PilQ
MFKKSNLVVYMLSILLAGFMKIAIADDSKHLVSLDVDNVAVSDVLHIIANFLNINMVISPEVSGTLTLHMTQVSPQEMLNTVLSLTSLTKLQVGHTWMIATRATAIEKQQEQLKLQQIMEEAEPLTSKIWQIQYAKASDIAHILQENNVKHKPIQVDERTNSLYVQDTMKHLNNLTQTIKQLDVPVKQVLIKARLATVDTDFEKQLGIQFDALQEVGEMKAVPLATPSLPHYSLVVAKLADGSLLDVKLSALENEGHGELISSPSLFTANQQTASIESGEEIPYQEISKSGATGVAFKKAVLSLKVTPQIMPNNEVLLHLQVNQDKPSHRVVLGVPAISTRQMTTNVLVKNGQTIGLGGIYEANKEDTYQRIPFLSKIPLIGILFQKVNQIENKRELLIFITPTIL